MRRIGYLAGLLALWTATARGQDYYPAERTVILPQVAVRGGPSDKFAATNLLQGGARVIVVAPSKDDPQWVKIRPPADSFSWIRAKQVSQVKEDPRIGFVKDGTKAPVLPGISLSQGAPDVESTKLEPGCQVVILRDAFQVDGELWFPIQPPPTEFRFLPASAIQENRVQVASNNYPTGQFPTGIQPTNPGTQWPTQNQTTFTPTTGSWQPANPTTSLTPKTPFQTAALTKNQWSEWGILRTTSFQRRDGLPFYALQRNDGTLIQYVVPQPGTSLQNYLGRQVSLYGSVLQNDDYPRASYLQASHVAVP